MVRTLSRDTHRNVRGLVAAAMTLLLLLSAAPSARAQFVDGDPETPAEIVDYFVRAEVGLAGEHDSVKRRLRAQAKACAPLIAGHLRVPDDLDGWEMDVVQPVGQPFSRAMSAVFSHRLLQELGREHADSILKQFFVGNRKLLEQAALGLEKHARGEAEGNDELMRLLRAQEYFSGMMTRAIRVAVEMRTPVLVEPVVEFYEAGLEHRYTHWADYALLHSPQHEDVVPRLRAVMESPDTPATMRHEIERAFERFTASLALLVREAGPYAPLWICTFFRMS